MLQAVLKTSYRIDFEVCETGERRSILSTHPLAADAAEILAQYSPVLVRRVRAVSTLDPKPTPTPAASPPVAIAG